jgi:hypothetical protein
MFCNKLVTIFSASNYCEDIDNKSAMLILQESGEIQQKIFSSLVTWKDYDNYMRLKIWTAEAHSNEILSYKWISE